MPTVVQLPTGKALTVRAAADAFLDSLRNPNTVRSYATGVGKTAERIGEARPLGAVADDEIGEALELLWGTAAVNTWNARRAAVLSWLGWDEPADPATVDEGEPQRAVRSRGEGVGSGRPVGHRVLFDGYLGRMTQRGFPNPCSVAMRSMSAGVPAMMVRACSVTRSAGQSHHAARCSRSMPASSNRCRIGLAGLPPTIV